MEKPKIMLNLQYSKILKQFNIKVFDLPEELKDKIKELDNDVMQYSIKNDEELGVKIEELDKEVSDKLNEWLDEDIDNNQSGNPKKDYDNQEDRETVLGEEQSELGINENEEEFIETVETKKQQIINSLNDKFLIHKDKLQEILGRKLKYPLEEIEGLRLVKIFLKPYYHLRNNGILDKK